MTQPPPALTRLTPVATMIAGVVVFSFLFFTGACAEQGLFDCSYDSDCFGDEYCINNQCRAQCSEDDDCFMDSYCGAYQRDTDPDPVQVCLDPEETDQGCESDEQCRDRFGDEDARCGIHDRCVLTSPNDDNNGDDPQNDNDTNDIEPDDDMRLLVVEQLGADGEPVDDDDNDDADDDDYELEPVRIGAVVIRDEADSLVGSGQTISVDSPHDEGADPELTYPLDDTGTCVSEPDIAGHTSLEGPGGIAWIELVEESGLLLDTDDVWTVEVIANGPHCPLGGFDGDEEDEFATYRAAICEIEAADPLPDVQDCQHRFDDPMQGFSQLEVTFSD